MEDSTSAPSPAEARRYSASRLESAARRGDVGGLRAELERADAPQPSSDRLAADLDDALVEAAASGRELACAYLLDRGANPRANESRALRKAVESGKLEAARLLLQRGADPCAKENEALRDAAMSGRLRLAEALLDAGADPRCEGALANAIRWGHAAMTKLLLDRSGPLDAERLGAHLVDAVERGDAPCAALLLERGADPRALEHRALKAAAMARRLDLVELLLAAGADASALDEKPTGGAREDRV